MNTQMEYREKKDGCSRQSRKRVRAKTKGTRRMGSRKGRKVGMLKKKR